MSYENLARMVGASYGRMPLEERKKAIRKLCKEGANKVFIKTNFPQFYKEAFPNG